MTHDELMDRIYWHWRYVQGQDGLQAMTDYRRTVLAVVELHRPIERPKWLPIEFQGYSCNLCPGSYPCPTIKAIEKELV